MNNPFESLLTLEEAAEKWDLKDSDILEKILDNIFVQGRDVKKIDNTWLVDISAMNREFGNLNKESDLIISNMPYANLSYESYIKNAFECDRDGDPAKLANGDIFDIGRDENQFYLSKAAVSYAAVIYNNRIREEFDNTLTDQERNSLKDLARSIGQSDNKDELYEFMGLHNSLIWSIQDSEK